MSEKNTAVSIRHQQTQRQLVLAANQAHFGGAAHPAGMAPGAWGCGDNPRALVAEQVSSELAQHSTAQHVVVFSSARELLFGSQTVQNGQTGQCSALSRTRTELPGGGSARHPREMQPEGANKKIRTYHSTSKYTVFLQSTLPIRV